MPRIADVATAINKLNGPQVTLGLITATTSKNNGTTAVPFPTSPVTLGGKYLTLQSDTAFYLAYGVDNTVTATSADTLIDAGVIWPVSMDGGYLYIAVLPVSGTSNVKVKELV